MGVVRYLAEAGQLPALRVISTVSGGSIFGAFAATALAAVLLGRMR